MECVNYKYCDLIGTPKFLPLAQECCRFSPDPSPSQRRGVGSGHETTNKFALLFVSSKGVKVGSKFTELLGT